MVRKFELLDLDRRKIEQAMARLDARKQRERRAKWAAARAVRERREKEQAEAKRAELHARAIFGLRGGGSPEMTRKLQVAGWKAVAARMEPGAWYSFTDLRALNPEFAKGSVRAWLKQHLLAKGLVERAGNPDFDDRIPQGLQVENRYLQRLTAEGERLAATWRAEMGL